MKIIYNLVSDKLVNNKLEMRCNITINVINNLMHFDNIYTCHIYPLFLLKNIKIHFDVQLLLVCTSLKSGILSINYYFAN